METNTEFIDDWNQPPKNPHAQALGRLGGQKKSEKKAAAARENGKKHRKKSAEKIIQTGQNLQKSIPASP